MLSQLQQELKAAMKSKDKALLIALRNIIGKIKIKQIDKGEELSKIEYVEILFLCSKQLKDSINQYKKGGRDDLAKKEEFELKLIEKYLPKQPSEDEIRELIHRLIKLDGNDSMANMGKIMGVAMNELGGSVDGKIVKNIVTEELSK